MFHYICKRIFAYKIANNDLNKNKKMENNIKHPGKMIPVKVVGALAEAFGRSIATIYRWAQRNDDRLTSAKANKVYAEYGFEWKADDVLDGQLAS
jgi:hypothetical protein